MKDLTGRTFGRLTALKRYERGTNGAYIWQCRCACGREVFASVTALTSGKKTSCGCAARGNITGERFGRLVARYPTDAREGTSVVWHCECDCGGVKDVSLKSLRGGRVKSCGCLRRRHAQDGIQE